MRDAVIARVQSLQIKLIDLTLDRVRHLLDRLGNPEQRLPPVVHIAGTNGKGSTVAFLRAMAESAGYRVHAYTSPHLVRFAERIRVAGELIAEDRLIELLEQVETANNHDPISFFELATCAAFVEFARVPADLLILETGLGGRFDATNVLERPAVCALTPISLDHEAMLGSTIARIAGEKAPILKAGVAGVIAPQTPEALEVIRAHAARIGAPLFEAGRDWSFERAPDRGLLYHSANGTMHLPPPALLGDHQYINAALAIACAERLNAAGFDIDERSIAQGLWRVEWAGRMQQLASGPLVDALPEGWELWLDGGHNPGAGEVLAPILAGWQDQPLHLIVGMLTTKDAGGFLRQVAPYASSITAVAIPGHDKAFAPHDLAAAATAAGARPAATAPSVTAALEHIMATEEHPARVLVCGSLYLLGTILENHA